MILLRLFGEFFLTGLFAFGGGLATLPFLYSLGERTGWFQASEVVDMLAVSESTPGPIGINMATFAGCKTAGIPGGIAATLGLVAPSIIVIVIVAKFLARFKTHPLVQNTFYGLRPASTGMIAAACLGIVKVTLLDWALFQETGLWGDLFNGKAILLAAVLLIAVRLTRKHPVIYIAAAAAAGILFQIE